MPDSTSRRLCLLAALLALAARLAQTFTHIDLDRFNDWS